MNRILDYWSAFVALFYPHVCEVCGDVLCSGERYVCSRCLCDFPYDEDEHEDLLFRFGEVHAVEAVYALFYYHRLGRYRNLIHAVKYHGRQKLGIMLGEMLGQRMGKLTDVDVLLPMPLHVKRERERGYNQAELIAKGISNVCQIPICLNAVKRLQNNPSQTGLSHEERAENVRHIFKLENGSALSGLHVLVVDDVITTGATLASLLSVLQQIPDLRVSVACLARAKDG